MVRMNIGYSGIALIVVSILALFVFIAIPASADRYSSSSYTIDASTMNTFGGSSNSTSYNLVSSGGETVIGEGSGGSYKLGEGYVSQLHTPFIELTIQPQGLVAYYPLEEGLGTTVLDYSSNSNNGTVQNGPTWGTGKIGKGMVFMQDNLTQVVEIPDSSSVSPTSAVTVAAWIFMPDMTKTVGVINGAVVKDISGGFSNPPYELSVINNDIFFITTSNINSTVQVNTPGALSSNTWYHAVGTFDSTTGEQKIYLNGQLANSGTQPDPMYDSAGLLHLGRQKSGYAGRYLNGTLDHVKIFDRAFTAAEVKSEYDAQSAGYETGLSLGTIFPGISNMAQYEAITKTNVSDYSLAVNQSVNLTLGGTTIPAISSGTIGSPSVWNEGVTKGLGFTLVSGSGVPSIWGSGANYAALPGSATTFYTRTGYTPYTKDVLGMRLRLDVDSSQLAGDYSNSMTITGTVTP